MRALILLVPAVFIWAPTQHAQAQSLTGSRAVEEREIAAVRTVYQDVTGAAASGQLARRDSTVQCPDDLEQEVTRWTDPSGRIRQLTWVAGTDDHSETHRFYYDGSGRLRFIFVSFGAVNGTGQEERVYYAADGRLLRRRKTRIHGPGYPFADAEPVWRPEEWLRRLCSDGR